MKYTQDGILSHLKGLAEKKYGDFSASLIPGTDNMLGVRIPVLRTYAKEIAKDDYESFLLNVGKSTFEEIMLKAFVIGYIKADIEYILKQVEAFVPMIDNWSVNDCFCATLKITIKNPERVLKYLQPYINSKKEFENRFASIMLMDYYLTDDYIDMVLDVYGDFSHDGYYARMGVAWGVATAYVKYPDKTMKFLQQWKTDDWTYNKSIQKMRESYRVSDEDKAILNTMKR